MTTSKAHDEPVVSIILDGKPCVVPKSFNVLQAAISNRIEIPRFCYHEQLSVAANCRMCLVEVCNKENSPGVLVASCAHPVADNMIVNTKSSSVVKARRGVMEFLLINHPLDCPICDQGGECDLQDQAMEYGRSMSRYDERKRAVAPQDMGPHIVTHMTRCIHCTRCIRFGSEIAGVDSIGMLHRGENAVITSLNLAVDSELSGNLVDVCPVGALNAKVYSGTARSWELRTVRSIDAHDAVGSSINIQAASNAIMRILPHSNPELNGDWIPDKVRFSFDGLLRDRLDRPYVRKNKKAKLEEASWQGALDKAASILDRSASSKTAFLAGDLCTVEEVFALLSLAKELGIENRDCRQYGEQLPIEPSAVWRCNTKIEDMSTADAILMIGVNPRREAPLLNLRLLEAQRAGAKIATIGYPSVLNYPVTHLGDNPGILQQLVQNEHPWVKNLIKAKRPLILFGSSAVSRDDAPAILHLVHKLCTLTGADGTKWMGYNFVHRASARCGAMMAGFLPGQAGLDRNAILRAASEGEMDCLYFLGCNELDPDVLLRARRHGCQIIVQGHHGDSISALADVILPGAAFTEKFGLFANTEARPQWAQQAVFPPGMAKEDWRIIRAVSACLKRDLPFDTHEALLEQLFVAVPELKEINRPHPGVWGAFGKQSRLMTIPFADPMPDFTASDPICRASPHMENARSYAARYKTEATLTTNSAGAVTNHNVSADA